LAYVSGETQLYLGRKYRLRIRPSEHEDVKLWWSYLYIFTRQPANAEQVRKLIYGWYANTPKCVSPSVFLFV